MKYKGMHVKRLCVLILIIPLFFIAELAIADTEAGGIIAADTTWSSANSPYILINDVQIDRGVTLTIEPGVVVNGENFGIKVWGTLNATGSNASKIIFNNVAIIPGTSGSPTEPFFLIDVEFSEINSIRKVRKE